MKVLSAMQPSGTLHLGNFFGSMLPNRGYQDSAEQALFFIVDLRRVLLFHGSRKIITILNFAGAKMINQKIR